MAKAKVSKQIQKLFLRLLNFAPGLLDKTQEEAKRQNTSFDALIRKALEEHLRDLWVARDEADLGEYARLLLRAHFAEDRNELLTEASIRTIGAETPLAIGNSKPH